jgi:hypothetical protein
MRKAATAPCQIQQLRPQEVALLYKKFVNAKEYKKDDKYKLRLTETMAYFQHTMATRKLQTADVSH